MPKSPTPTQSPTPGSAGRKRRNPEDIDKSKWRSSFLKAGATVNKKAAIETYHLSRKDLEGISFEREQITSKESLRPMYVYQEAEIEQKAWEKYGGPDRFDEMLSLKREKFIEKYGTESGKAYPEPRSYLAAKEERYKIEHAPATRSGYDAVTPNLREMKSQLLYEGNQWLWEGIVDGYWKTAPPSNSKWTQELIIRGALSLFVHNYPPRTVADSGMRRSDSFVALQKTLDRALVWGGEANEQTKIDFHVTYISFPDYREIVEWSSSYLNEIYDALASIIAENGAEGWRNARWLVYDKSVASNLGGMFYKLYYGQYVWYDDSTMWLHPLQYKRMDRVKRQAFLASLNISSEGRDITGQLLVL